MGLMIILLTARDQYNTKQYASMHFFCTLKHNFQTCGKSNNEFVVFTSMTEFQKHLNSSSNKIIVLPVHKWIQVKWIPVDGE